MNSKALAIRMATATLVAAVTAGQLFAQPPDILQKYRFIPSKTTVHLSGGAQNYNLDLTIAGRFGLITGYNEVVDPTAHVPSLVPFAEFTDVHGILFNPLSLAPLPLPGWDLDKTLNLSGLNGTFSPDNPNQLYFLGADGNGVALRVEVQLNGGWLHLTGGSSDPIGAKPVLYRIDALAHLTPFPDFDGDGALTAADVPLMLEALTDMNRFEAQHAISSDDLVAMADLDGSGKVTNADIQLLLDAVAAQSNDSASAVPEPATLVQMMLAILGLVAFYHRSTRLLAVRR